MILGKVQQSVYVWWGGGRGDYNKTNQEKKKTQTHIIKNKKGEKTPGRENYLNYKRLFSIIVI